MIVPRCLLLLTVLLFSVPVHAAEGDPATEPVKIDKDYLQSHYPELYQQIIQEGREETSQPATKSANQTDVATKNEAAAPKKEELGDWWNRNSLTYEPRPSQLLFHTELQYSYSEDRGNVEGYEHRGGAKFIVRLDRVTNSLSYLIDKSKQTEVASGGETSNNYQILEDSLQYDLTKKLYAMGGIIREVNETEMLDRRYAFYAGLGYPLLTQKNHQIDLYLAYAYLDEEYDSLINTILGFSGRTYDAFYFNQTYAWKITDKILFSQRFRIIHSFEDFIRYDLDANGNVIELGEQKRDLVVFGLGLDFQLTESFTLYGKYQLNIDNVPWPTVLKQDTSYATGIKFSF
ncbi:MAG: DUF481 domain-containing protein [Proteobacteria bacterium]|nr:DUF481 domain-containing protein [Pseudomonadota bacterium]MBU1714998.1 DUF481 domain-containing protein [Pseudomonadota bacterium]